MRETSRHDVVDDDCVGVFGGYPTDDVQLDTPVVFSGPVETRPVWFLGDDGVSGSGDGGEGVSLADLVASRRAAKVEPHMTSI